MSITYDRISIVGHNGRQIRNTLYRQNSGTGEIALVFPGYGYNSNMPLLYYTIEILLRKGLNVLAVELDYSNQSDFKTASQDDRNVWLHTDVEAAFNSVATCNEFEIKVLVGKSLGTLACGYLIDKHHELAGCKVIWLTPLLGRHELVDQITKYRPQSLFVIGTADPHYDMELLSRVQEASNGEVLVLSGANHSLEVPGPLSASLEILYEIMEKVGLFFG
ncbi:MAG: hypothetical protein ACTSUO_02070 [Candidatus Thorarchaeota archaeon]